MSKRARTRRKRRGEKQRTSRRGPNKPSKHKGRSGRSGGMHRKKTRSKKVERYRMTITWGMPSIELHRIER